MKATGIVRRIDDLGRVVIPKEIRRTMRIREGEPLEIYTSGSGEVIFKKYSPVGEMGESARLLSEAAAKQTAFSFIVCDRDHCIAAAGAGSREYLGCAVGGALEKIMESRKAKEFSSAEAVPAFDSAGAGLVFAVPIIAAGDIAGAVALLKSEVSGEATDADRGLANCCASFLSKQLEL